MQFRPCIDIRKGKVTQIVGSSIGGGEKTNWIAPEGQSSTFFAHLYQRNNLYGGHAIMLDKEPETIATAKEALSAFPGGLHIGGGITAENAQEWLEAGASHVIVTSYVFREGTVDLERLKSLVAAAGGKQHVVLDLSCRKDPTKQKQGGGKDADKYFVVTDRWQKFTNYPITEENLQFLSQYCDEFLVHGVDVEGKKQGIEEELVARLAEWSPIPVTYAGGVSKVADMELIRARGQGKVHVTIGSALDIFGGEKKDLKFEEVVEWFKKQRAE